MTKETPILFKRWKIQKILNWNWEALNMQTRRLSGLEMMNDPQPGPWTLKKIYGSVGDLLWVREAISVEMNATQSDIECGHFTYKADDVHGDWTKENGYKTRSPIFMYKWQARIWLQIVDLRVERLQQITFSDIKKEAILDKDVSAEAARARWIDVWDRINAKKGLAWERNPWVWKIEFKRVRKP